MLLADFGTSYCKILDTASEGEPRIVATRDLDRAFSADLATGHNAARRSRRSINELTALARGGIELVGRPDFVLLDCGSRDIKFVRFVGGRVADMGWNAECGASMGFTIELLSAYYGLDYASLAVVANPAAGCGTQQVIGMHEIEQVLAEAMQRVVRVVRAFLSA